VSATEKGVKTHSMGLIKTKWACCQNYPCVKLYEMKNLSTKYYFAFSPKFTDELKEMIVNWI
jgi:hypothetical protein